MARRKPRRNSSFKPRLPETDEPPSLTQLEQFSQLSLRRWLASARALTELHTLQFFGLELERQRRSGDLIGAVRASLLPGEPFEKWARIVDYRYCLALFPQNWFATNSFIEVMDGAPSTARLVRIDGSTRALQ